MTFVYILQYFNLYFYIKIRIVIHVKKMYIFCKIILEYNVFVLFKNNLKNVINIVLQVFKKGSQMNNNL